MAEDLSVAQQLESNTAQIKELIGLVAQLATNNTTPSIGNQAKT
jgi:hypothetical protein